jgi:7-keto-8-aminopelargonate synthetase-like enzyme
MQKVRFFKERLALGGFKELGPSQIVPLIIGEAGKALAAAEDLKREGLFVTAVRPPTVPEGSARLRLSITRHHSLEDLAMAADAIKGVLESPLLRG